MQKTPVFVVSLASASDRRRRISEHLKSIGVDFRLIDAVDGRKMPATQLKELVAEGRNYQPGVIGCYLSHLMAYKAISDENIEAALVLEDDARLHPDTAAWLRAGLRSTDFDYCFLDCDPHNIDGPVYYDLNSGVELGPGIQGYELSAGPQTLHAYLIGNRAAKRRLEHALPIDLPIDVHHHLPYPIKFRAVVKPKLAWVSEDSLTSFTSDRQDSVNSLFLSKLRRSPRFYTIRDMLKLKAIRDMWAVRQALAAGKLPQAGRWRRLPSGREVIL